MISRFFIDRPIFAAVIAIFIVLAGLVTYDTLPVSQYPEISPPTVKVRAIYPGANAQVLADTVAQPIEEQVNGVEGMIYMSSNCASNGEYSLMVTFEIGADLDLAAVRVQNRVAMAVPALPEEVQRQGVTTKKESTNMVQIISLYSPDQRYDTLFLSNYAALQVKDELARLDGVGNVAIFGASEYSMRIWIDPDKLKSRGLTASDVVNAVREQNVQVAAGQVGQPPAPIGQNFQFTVNVQGRLENSVEFEEIVLKTSNDNQLTRLKDVARVELGSQNYDQSCQFMGKPCIVMAIFQLPGANSLDLAKRVETRMEALSKNFPEGLEHQIPFDTTLFVTASIHEVTETFIIAALLVFLVVLVFLQDWRASLIPAITIPVSLIGTFAVMGFLGFGINTLTLFGLVLAIGIVVDDAIVVVENSVRNIETHGLEPRKAAIRAMGEVTGPIVAITLVLMAVFLPTAFIGGVTGQLYRQFALTIAASTAFSGINALTLSPALCAIILRRPPERRNWFARAFNWTFGKTTNFYQHTVGAMVRRGALMLLLFLLLGGGAYWGFIQLPTGFVPAEDQGYAFLSIQLPDASSIERVEEVVDQLNQMISKMEGIEKWVLVPGFSLIDSAVASNAATGWIVFKQWDERTDPRLSKDALIGRMWREFRSIQEANIFVFAPPSIQGMGQSGGFQMEVQDRGDVGLQALQNMIEEWTFEANTQPGLANVYSTFRANEPQRLVDIDRTKVKTLDIPLSMVFDTLQANLGSVYVNDFNRFGRTYQVRVQAAPAFRNRTKDIERFEVRSNRGEIIPLGTLVDIKETVGPKIIRRYNMYPSASIKGGAALGYSSGEALDMMEKLVRTSMPHSMDFEWTGMSYQEKAVGDQAIFIMALAVLMVYLLLCALYESWSLPMAVILVVPLALLGTVVAVTVRGLDMNVYTQIGIIVLIALASKNAILIVEFARDLHNSGKGIVESAIEAARLRFRAILMTSFAFILGTLPLAIATGAGAASRQALGTAVVGGMIAGTFLAVLFVPVFYVLIQRLSEWIRSKKNVSIPK